MQDLHTENYKTMLRESKLSREMDCKTIFPKLIYRFPKLGSTGSQIDLQVPKFQMPFFFFPEKDKLIQKFTQICKENKIGKIILKKNKVEGFTFFNLQRQ